MSEADMARLANIAANLCRGAYADPQPFDHGKYRRAFMAAAAISALDPDAIAAEERPGE